MQPKYSISLYLQDRIYQLYDTDVEDEGDGVQLRKKHQKPNVKSWVGRMEDDSESTRDTVFIAF